MSWRLMLIATALQADGRPGHGHGEDPVARVAASDAGLHAFGAVTII